MNIITIDFDIIMAPSINYYNDFIDEEYEITNSLSGIPSLIGDLNIYNKLTQYLIKCFQNLNQDQILFIDDHGQILSVINNPINLINIDHHHDTGYDNSPFLIQEKFIDCSNWARWLFEQKLLNNYTWINNDNSDTETLNPKYVNQIFHIKDYNLNNLLLPDKLIICLSKPWVPPRYRLLFYQWQELYKSFYKVQKVPYLEGPYII